MRTIKHTYINIVSIFMVILVLGCAEVKPKNTVPNIAGRYDLLKGSLVFNDHSNLGKMLAGTLIIEKVSKNVFGYYEMIKYKGLKPNTYWGGYLYKDGRFVKYPYNHLVHKFETNKDTTLKINGKYLTIKSIFLNGKDEKYYKKVSFDAPLYISFKQAYKQAKMKYEKYYKPYIIKSNHQ